MPRARPRRLCGQVQACLESAPSGVVPLPSVGAVPLSRVLRFCERQAVDGTRLVVEAGTAQRVAAETASSVAAAEEAAKRLAAEAARLRAVASAACAAAEKAEEQHAAAADYAERAAREAAVARRQAQAAEEAAQLGTSGMVCEFEAWERDLVAGMETEALLEMIEVLTTLAPPPAVGLCGPSEQWDVRRRQTTSR